MKFEWSEVVIFLGLFALMAIAGLSSTCASTPKPTPPKPDKKALTAQDVLLALEAHEARCKCENNDEFAKQFAQTLEESGIPRLPGVKR